MAAGAFEFSPAALIRLKALQFVPASLCGFVSYFEISHHEKFLLQKRAPAFSESPVGAIVSTLIGFRIDEQS